MRALSSQRETVVKRRASLRKQRQRERDQIQEPDKEGDGKVGKKREKWVVGQFGEGGVKDRRKGDEEELKHLRSMGVVRKRLKEKEKVREHAVKIFKHRYVLDPDSTQKSNTILVTGYDSSPGEECAVDKIRRQSSIVISSFFDQPTRVHPVLCRLSSSQRERLERVVVGGRGGRGGEGHRHAHSEPLSEGGTSVRRKRVRFHRGRSVEGIGDEDHRHDDCHAIPKAKSIHTRTKSAPSETTPLAPPPPPTIPSGGTPLPENGSAEPSPPPALQRSPSYLSAMETEDVVATVTKQEPRMKPRRGRSSQATPQKEVPRKERRLFFRRKKKGREVSEEEESMVLCLDPVETAALDEGAGLVRSNGDIITESATVGRDGFDRETAEEDSPSPQESPKPKPSPQPPRPFDPSRSLNHRQFSITSLPGRDPSSRRYYTPLSPRVDKVTGTYAGDANPFAQDFDRALQEQASLPRNPAPLVTRSNTQLPDDIIADEGFQNFLKMVKAEPSTSMYITYQIQLISDKIDTKYGKHLNQALDKIIPEIMANSVSWENFSSACRSLMFQGEGFKDGLFMVPAFGKRLLGFLPGMRDVITTYTQDVLEQYAMDWLLMRGGWVS